MSFRTSYAIPRFARFAFAASAAGSAFGMAAAGCSDTDDAAPESVGSFEAGADASLSSACTSCVAQECSGAWALCLTDPRCVALRACATPLRSTASQSSGARQECFCSSSGASGSTDGGADPLAAYAAFASCNDTRTCGACSSDCTSSCTNGAPRTMPGSCGSPSGDAGDAGDAGATATDAAIDLDAGDAEAGDASDAAAPAAPESCSTCISNRCGDPKKLCALGSECSVFLECAYGCADVSCVDACGTSHATGRAGALELSSCTLTSCRSACGL